MASCFAQSKMYAPNMMAVSKHRETSAGATLWAALCDRSTSRFFANLHTICWFQSSQCHRGVPSRALNTIGRRRCRTNLRESRALSVVESWGDDVPEGKVTSFPMAVQRKDDETVVFSWIVWPSKEARKAAWDKMMADPRMKPEANPMPFDGKRMIYGGFEPIIER